MTNRMEFRARLPCQRLGRVRPRSSFCPVQDASPPARRNSLFFPAVREFCSSGSRARAQRNRQNPTAEQADNRRLLWPVMPKLELCFCWVFREITDRNVLLRALACGHPRRVAVEQAAVGSARSRAAYPRDRVRAGLWQGAKSPDPRDQAIVSVGVFRLKKISRKFGARASRPDLR